MPIIIVPFIIRGHVRTGREPSPLCMAQLLFQVNNFLLHGLVAVLSLGYVTSHSGVASARLGSVLHTNGANCKATIFRPSLKSDEGWPNDPGTMNL